MREVVNVQLSTQSERQGKARQLHLKAAVLKMRTAYILYMYVHVHVHCM